LSRVGKKPIVIPADTEVNIDGNEVIVKGKLGQLSQFVDNSIKLNIEDNKLKLIPLSDSKEVGAKHGLYRNLLNNMIIGVSGGFQKTLKIVGVGYRVSKKGEDLEILIGYSNPVIFKKPEGVSFEIPDNTTIIVKGINKQIVGQIASTIRDIRKPEPYKGKGIKYSDEVIKRKVGKAAATASK
jgi:large subunit ribosomal protein L6